MNAIRAGIGPLTVMLAGLSLSVGCSRVTPEGADGARANQQLIDRFDASRIVALLAGIDASLTPDTAASSEGRLGFRAPDGRSFAIEARQCAQKKPDISCEGLTLTGLITIPPDSDIDLMAYANDFNREQASVYMFFDQDALFLSDDVILDGGVTPANLASSLSTFVSVLGQHQRFLVGDSPLPR